ncbi:MAG: DUF3302 domain-containing protein [Pseudomonadota bacterium]
MHLIDWSLTGWDYLTFLFLLVLIIAFFYVLIQLGGLPGKIAERRNHPHAEAVKITGWIGLFTIFPWIHAIIWAMHEATLVDVRAMPDTDIDLAGQKASVYGIAMPAGPEKNVVGRPAHRDSEGNEATGGDQPDTPAQSEPDKSEKPA